MVDSCDRDRVGIAQKELIAMLEEEELKNTILLVFANKQDQPNPMSDIEVSNALGLSNIKNRQWQIFKSSAIKGEGLENGLKWLSSQIQAKKT